MTKAMTRVTATWTATSIAGSMAVIMACAAAPPAAAQRNGPSPHAANPHQHLPQPPEKLPPVSPQEQGGNLDFLFGALKAAPDKDSAKHVEARIWASWSVTSSDTTALLMARVKVAIEHKDTTRALQLLDAVVQLQPDYIEGWNRRATLHFLTNDYARSLADIRQVLAREPRHFGALTGLGMIMQELGDDRHALQAFRRALDVNPHLGNVSERIRTLSEKVEGRDI